MPTTTDIPNRTAHLPVDRARPAFTPRVVRFVSVERKGRTTSHGSQE
jgi:hypothetical protein